jgi:hypothetical protein
VSKNAPVIGTIPRKAEGSAVYSKKPGRRKIANFFLLFRRTNPVKEKEAVRQRKLV